MRSSAAGTSGRPWPNYPAPTSSKPSTNCLPTPWLLNSTPSWASEDLIATDSPEAGDRIADLVGDLGLAAVQLGRIEEGGRLIQAPDALVLHNLIERPLI